MSTNTGKEIEKNKQVGVRLPINLYKILENKRLEAEERGERVTITDLVVKYLYAGLGRSKVEPTNDVDFIPTLERLTTVLERLEKKL
jgi:hypothetical protein